MQHTSDTELLRAYAEEGLESAFGEIVARYTDLVFSAALRQSSSHDLASEICQSVFADLARKAAGVAGQMSAETSLAGWLYRATRYAVLTALRDERRRQAQERLVMEQMYSERVNDPGWDQVAPMLDEAMAALNDSDRDAVLLRFFQNQDFRAVGLALGINDDAAQKRVSRAIERLRGLLAKKGVGIGVGGLISLISANAVQAAPAGLSQATLTIACAGTSSITHATTTITTTIAMTSFQKILIVAVSTAILTGSTAYVAKSRQAQPTAKAATTQKEITITPDSIQTIADARLGDVVSVGIAVNATRKMNKAPNLLSWTITDQAGVIYRYFDYPQYKRSAIFVRGLHVEDYTPTNHLVFKVLFPLQQISDQAGAVYLDGTMDVGMQRPEPFHIKVR